MSVNVDLNLALTALNVILKQCKKNQDTTDVQASAPWTAPAAASADATADAVANEHDDCDDSEPNNGGGSIDAANTRPALVTVSQKHKTVLKATRRGNAEVLSWVRAILGCGATDTRLFVAGDEAGQSDLAPASFGEGLPQMLSVLEATAEEHQPALDAAVAALDEGTAHCNFILNFILTCD